MIIQINYLRSNPHTFFFPIPFVFNILLSKHLIDTNNFRHGNIQETSHSTIHQKVIQH